MTKRTAALTIDDCREIVILRTKAARLFVLLLWLHIPVVLTMAVLNHIDWKPQAAILLGLLIPTTLYTMARPSGLATRNLIAVALTAMPIFFVFDNTGRLQIDYHMYFFVIFAMLIAFCDWRPIVISAIITSLHHLLFNFIDRSRVFPTEGGIGRVALHAIMVAFECGILIWAVSQLRKLFMTAERTQELAIANAELEASKQRLEQATESRIEGLERVALTDSLTQLGNHRAFSDDFAREVARAQRHGHPLTLALVDIDNFKLLNDDNGHKYGDDSLMRLARLFRTLRREDRAYRVGGDEFAIIFVETVAVTAKTALERLRDEARNTLLGATISVGYVGLDATLLAADPYELADAALYEAKRRGRDVVVGFDELDRRTELHTPRTASICKQLIEKELIDVAFQPIWDIATCKPFGFEALTRPHVELRLKGPAELFDMAERLRMLPQLDHCCIRKAFASSAKLPAGSTIFVKITSATLADPEFNAHEFVAMARSSGLLPQQVVLEIGKRPDVTPALVVARGEALSALGVRLALANVTSDKTGVELLTKLQISYVKIDNSLLKTALTDEASRSVIEAIAKLAQIADSYVIAEGVENAEILDFACRRPERAGGVVEGIRGVQGYLLGRPSIDAFDVADLHTWGKFLSAHFIKVAV
ncbi:MAG TPA: bifunctional diguanylate cyclase/phosphodiesterase [Candidatus Eremiobacteraceae bacterium]|nr:bifunctional diguanylate cyclase/phosphodiesterase [Candidatus Eremiobacteraceae bacterium]